MRTLITLIDEDGNGRFCHVAGDWSDYNQSALYSSTIPNFAELAAVVEAQGSTQDFPIELWGSEFTCIILYLW